MNRRLMMVQQNKGFELVYNSSSGTLPTEQNWAFNYWIYGNSIGGTQSMDENLLEVNVKHVYEAVRYRVRDKLLSKKCELSVSVDSISGVLISGRMGILLTDGEKVLPLVFRPQNNGIIELTHNANETNKGKWIKWLGNKTSFKLRVRLEGGIGFVWFDDTLLTTTSDLYSVSEIYTSYNHFNAGNPWYSCADFLFPRVENSIAFSVGGIYYVSQLTYKEW